MVAAFFDLDKTVIARASMAAFGRPFRAAGLLSRWLVLRMLYGQLVYLWLGADERRLTRVREAALRLTKGWHRDHVGQVVQETLEQVVEPIVHEEALAALRAHRDAGHRTYLVSASPQEVVAPLGRYLGVDGVIATVPRVDAEGRYSGELEFWAYGPNKATAMQEIAERDGLDLAASWAYSDSATDLPMLEAVGHPVVVNPDRELARIARARGWAVRTWTTRVRLRDRVPMPPAAPTAVGSGVAVVTAGLTVWWRLRRDRPGGRESTRRALSRAVRRTRELRPRGPSWPPRRRGR